MTRDYVECPEGAGKTIKSLKIYEHDTDGCETLIEFTDSTSFENSTWCTPSYVICFQKASSWNLPTVGYCLSTFGRGIAPLPIWAVSMERLRKPV